jgi:glycerol kinase
MNAELCNSLFYITGARPHSINIAGGSTKSELWLQMHADVCNIPFVCTEENEAPMLGAAVCVSTTMHLTCTLIADALPDLRCCSLQFRHCLDTDSKCSSLQFRHCLENVRSALLELALPCCLMQSNEIWSGPSTP